MHYWLFNEVVYLFSVTVFLVHPSSTLFSILTPLSSFLYLSISFTILLSIICLFVFYWSFVYLSFTVPLPFSFVYLSFTVPLPFSFVYLSFTVPLPFSFLTLFLSPFHICISHRCQHPQSTLSNHKAVHQLYKISHPWQILKK